MFLLQRRGNRLKSLGKSSLLSLRGNFLIVRISFYVYEDKRDRQRGCEPSG